MNKTLMILLALGALAFGAIWVGFFEVSVLPMLVICNVIACGLKYMIDRYGHPTIKTMKLAYEDMEPTGSGVQPNERRIQYAYVHIMWQYTVIICVVSLAVILAGGAIAHGPMPTAVPIVNVPVQ